MVEPIVAAGLAVAVPPCFRASSEIARDAGIMVKLAGVLHLSSRAKANRLFSRLLRVIKKIQEKLREGSKVLPDALRKEFVERLKRMIALYNDFALNRFNADSETHLQVLKSAKKASKELL
ncbi:hypothetical protein DL96DRAFT_1562843 [Flagelloscypha sp. PMI_526]|nr:hypothetical protein DL96DRAFT_1562843 [Flagelloscypha sp. PMI_526]